MLIRGCRNMSYQPRRYDSRDEAWADWRRMFDAARLEGAPIKCDPWRKTAYCKYGTMELSFYKMMIREEQAQQKAKLDEPDYVWTPPAPGGHSGGEACTQ